MLPIPFLNQVTKHTFTLNVSLNVHHELTIQNYQRDALNIIAAYQQDTRTRIESDGTICCLCATVSS